jgi:hypothetical protein
MLDRIARWRRGHLLAAWIGWWLLLAAWALGPALPILWRVTRPGRHGNVSASYGSEEGVRLVVSEGATSAWTGSVGIGELALWLAAPPLLLLLLWMWLARRDRADAPAARRDRVG